jgi:hypothetical protein
MAAARGRATIALGLALAAHACGGQTVGNSNNPQNSDDGGVTKQPPPDVDASIMPKPYDAGTDASQDDGPYPAAHYPLPMMQNLGGTVLAAPEVVTVTFKGNTNRDTERAFDDSIVTSSWWTTVTDGWGIAPGKGGVYVELDDTVSGKTLDDQNDLQPMIANWIASAAVPPPDANTVYAIYFPASTTITLQGSPSCQAFGGYHNAAPYGAGALDGGAGADAGGPVVAYAVLPDCGGGLTVTTSHELIEAATDPNPIGNTTWYGYDDAWWGAGGGEAADLCEGRGTVTVGSDDVAKSWVNKAAAASHDPCQPADPGEIFYSAAVPTQVVSGLHDPTGGPDYSADGFLLANAGDNKSIDVVVFSEAKLPNELSLVVGKRPRGATTPQQVDPIGAGVTASLSPTTGHNGTHVTLSLQIAASTAPGDYPFVVRAILNDNDYHSWPVILRVQ